MDRCFGMASGFPHKGGGTLPTVVLALSLVVQLSIGARKLALAHGDRLPSPDKKYDAATHRGMCQHVLTGGPDETCWMDAADIKTLL